MPPIVITRGIPDPFTQYDYYQLAPGSGPTQYSTLSAALDALNGTLTLTNRTRLIEYIGSVSSDPTADGFLVYGIEEPLGGLSQHPDELCVVAEAYDTSCVISNGLQPQTDDTILVRKIQDFFHQRVWHNALSNCYATPPTGWVFSPTEDEGVLGTNTLTTYPTCDGQFPRMVYRETYKIFFYTV